MLRTSDSGLRTRTTAIRYSQDEGAKPPQRSFDDAYCELYRVALGTARRILGNQSVAEDVAQEVLMKAYGRWETVADYAEPWVNRVARNLAIDMWRKDRGEEPPVKELSAPEQIDRVHDRAELTDALELLGHRQRDTFVLRFVHGYSPDEAAEMLGISRAGVLKNTTRALTSLRGLLGAR